MPGCCVLLQADDEDESVISGKSDCKVRSAFFTSRDNCISDFLHRAKCGADNCVRKRIDTLSKMVLDILSAYRNGSYNGFKTCRKSCYL